MQSALYDLIEPVSSIFADKRLIICGTLVDEQLLKLAAKTKRTQVIVDNYLCASRMAALMGQQITDAPEQSFNYKHLSVYYGSLERVLPNIEPSDVLLTILDKSKSQNQKILRLLSKKISRGGFIFTAGANDSGGKSASSLLKEFGDPQKSAVRRKCTLFGVSLEQNAATYQKLQEITFKCGGFEIKLMQDEAVFSKGRVDEGTSMLINALSRKRPPAKTALDLGCGCGVVGLSLKRLGLKEVLSTDISASALALTKENATLNALEVEVKSADMLQGLGKFDLIAVNPPFHQGTAVEREMAINMIREAPKHLNEGGNLFLVGNSFLGYEEKLKEQFSSVVCLEKTSKFCVYQAR